MYFLHELPNFHINFFEGSEEEENRGKSVEVSDSDVEKFIEGEEKCKNKEKDLLRLTTSQEVLAEECYEIIEIEKIPPLN